MMQTAPISRLVAFQAAFASSMRALDLETADRFIASIYTSWENLRVQQSSSTDDAHALGWLGTDDYLELAERSLERQVLRPLRTRGIPLSEEPEAGDVLIAPGIAPPLEQAPPG